MSLARLYRIISTVPSIIWLLKHSMAWKWSSVRSSYKRIEFPSDLVNELTTPGLQSLSKLFLGGQRQLILAREDLVPQVA